MSQTIPFWLFNSYVGEVLGLFKGTGTRKGLDDIITHAGNVNRYVVLMEKALA